MYMAYRRNARFFGCCFRENRFKDSMIYMDSTIWCTIRCICFNKSIEQNCKCGFYIYKTKKQWRIIFVVYKKLEFRWNMDVQHLCSKKLILYIILFIKFWSKFTKFININFFFHSFDMSNEIFFEFSETSNFISIRT